MISGPKRCFGSSNCENCKSVPIPSPPRFGNVRIQKNVGVQKSQTPSFFFSLVFSKNLQIRSRFDFCHQNTLRVSVRHMSVGKRKQDIKRKNAKNAIGKRKNDKKFWLDNPGILVRKWILKIFWIGPDGVLDFAMFLTAMGWTNFGQST